MGPITLSVIAGLVTLLVAGYVLPVVARRRFRAEFHRLATQLLGDAENMAAAKPDPPLAHLLPTPVRRYLKFAILPGAPTVITARLHHEGSFRTSPRQRWMRIRGEEVFTTSRPGFVWLGSVTPFPLFSIEARDSYVGGRGRMLVKLDSLFTIADVKGPEIDQGSALRWLGEAVWFPSAFASSCVRWEPIHALSARATLTDSDPPITGVADFHELGYLTRFVAQRYRSLPGGGSQLTPWIARCSDYQKYGPFRIPARVAVSWLIDGEEFTYARFQVTLVDYNVDGVAAPQRAKAP